MITIDGRQTELAIANYANLEDLLVNIYEMEDLQQRVITDVFVNNEQFKELYPHQAEDIEVDEVESVEIRSVTTSEMALSISTELDKVLNILQFSAQKISSLFREFENDEASLILVDTINVIRDFMAMLGVLRSEFVDDIDLEFVKNVETLSGLLVEITESMENKDWYLLSDLFEYEFIPLCDSWRSVLDNIRSNISKKIQ